jgi:hypothetical protein
MLLVSQLSLLFRRDRHCFFLFASLHPPLRSQLDIITNTLFSHYRADTFSHTKISITPYSTGKSQTEFAS